MTLPRVPPRPAPRLPPGSLQGELPPGPQGGGAREGPLCLVGSINMPVMRRCVPQGRPICQPLLHVGACLILFARAPTAGPGCGMMGILATTGGSAHSIFWLSVCERAPSGGFDGRDLGRPCARGAGLAMVAQ